MQEFHVFWFHGIRTPKLPHEILQFYLTTMGTCFYTTNMIFHARWIITTIFNGLYSIEMTYLWYKALDLTLPAYFLPQLAYLRLLFILWFTPPDSVGQLRKSSMNI